LAAVARVAEFAAAGLLNWSDCQLARHLTHLYQEDDELVTLGVGLTLAALRAGSVCLDLARAKDLLPGESADQTALRAAADLAWPEPTDWARRLGRSPVVTPGDGPTTGRPLRLVAGRLYLERSWDDQEAVARSIRARLKAPAQPATTTADRLDAIFPPTGAAAPDRRRQAGELALRRRFLVVGGGPGTGKTTTVARLLAVLADPDRPPRIVLAAPTGKAAARLDAAVRQSLDDLGLARLRAAVAPAGTVHRVLGIKPWGDVDYRLDHPLPADLVVVDETSMLSLRHMRLLLEAVPTTARLILVGDPDQLASVESGAVLADLVASQGPGAIPFVRLDHNYRFSGELTRLAWAIRAGQSEAVLSQLAAGGSQIEWIEADPAGDWDEAALGPLRQTVVATGQAVVAGLAAWSGGGDPARLTPVLETANQHRLLCAHRRGPYGVARWSAQAAAWLAQAIPGYGRGAPWHLGLPVQVTRNDDVLGVFNGDTGLVVEVRGQPRIALATSSGPRLIGPAELDGLEPIHASTIHKAQGSQFDQVTVIVPPPETSLLTRELLYTAVTRAQTRVRLIGTAAAVAHAVTHPALRASGLADRLARP
jgi:exodeoxyribonuclease V alpha subunit